MTNPLEIKTVLITNPIVSEEGTVINSDHCSSLDIKPYVNVDKETDLANDPETQYVEEVLKRYAEGDMTFFNEANVIGEENSFESFVSDWRIRKEGETVEEYLRRCARLDFPDGHYGGAILQDLYDELTAPAPAELIQTLPATGVDLLRIAFLIYISLNQQNSIRYNLAEVDEIMNDTENVHEATRLGSLLEANPESHSRAFSTEIDTAGKVLTTRIVTASQEIGGVAELNIELTLVGEKIELTDFTLVNEVFTNSDTDEQNIILYMRANEANATFDSHYNGVYLEDRGWPNLAQLFDSLIKLQLFTPASVVLLTCIKSMVE